MELRQLEYFVAVAEEANFTRAAERVQITQSGVSAQIKQLEHELGAALFDRSGRSIRLTAAGAAALEHARSALASAEAVRRAVDEVNGLVRGRLGVGMITACTVTPLFEALSAFHVRHPYVEITLTEGNSDHLTELVRSGELDVALVGVPGPVASGKGMLPFVSEPVVAFVPEEHPLAAKGEVKLADLAEYPLVCLPRGTGIRTAFDAGCDRGGVRPEVALQASAPAAVADLAKRGLGVAILSESMAAHLSGLTVVRILDLDIPAALALTWSSRQSAALGEFLRHARRAFTPPSAAGSAPPSGGAPARPTPRAAAEPAL